MIRRTITSATDFSFWLSLGCYIAFFFHVCEFAASDRMFLSIYLSSQSPWSELKICPCSYLLNCHIYIWEGDARKSMSIGSWKENWGRFAHRSEVHCEIYWLVPGAAVGALRKHIYTNIIDKSSTTLHLSKVDRYFIILWEEIRFHSQYMKTLNTLKLRNTGRVHVCTKKQRCSIMGPHEACGPFNLA